MSETWIGDAGKGGAGNADTAADWNATLQRWEVTQHQVQGGATVDAGAVVTFSSDFAFNNGSGPALLIGGTGDVVFTSDGTASRQISVQQALQIDTAATLELENVSITTSTLAISGTGTAEIEGGSLTSSQGFTLTSNQTLLLADTTYTTNSSIAGTGTIVLSGSVLDAAGGANPSDKITFADVPAGGAPNTLILPDYDTNLTITNLGYGDVIQVVDKKGKVENVSLVSSGAGGYDLVEGKNTLSVNVSLASGAAPDDFGNTTAGFTWTEPPPCFYPGTRLATAAGEIEVQHVRAGTMLKTASGALLPVRWLGWSEVSRRFADPLRSLPIRIMAGALAEGVPARDLLVSPDHAVFIEGVLAQAGALVNGVSIIREENVPESFRYYHVELATHELLLAENCPAESFVDNVDRTNFHNWDARETPTEAVAEMGYPRAKSSRQLPVGLCAALDARAARFMAPGAA
jgi:hypothetical protein